MDEAMQSCRMCGKSEFYSKLVDAIGGYGPNLLPIDIGWLGVLQGKAKLRIRVCGGCGHVEWFVPEDLLDKVRESFIHSPW